MTINNVHRPVSWVELKVLHGFFNREILLKGITFRNLTHKEICLHDFIEQYYEGNDYPHINLNAV